MIIPKFRIWPILWLIVALLLTFFSFAGGDTSILAGWLFLVWTVPFGVIWWFILYDYINMLGWFPDLMIQIGGELISVAAAYIFWFVFIPWIRTLQNK